jgi:homoserine kinase type II
MAVYTPLTEAEFAYVAECYGLLAIDGAHPITEGVENTNYLLEYCTQTGEAGRAILTVFEARVNREDLPFFLGLKEHLCAKTIACPMPYRTVNGAQTVEVAGKQAALVSFLHGKSVLVPTALHTQQAGRMLARMHLATADFPLTRANSMSFTGWEALRGRISERKEQIAPASLYPLIEEELAYALSHWPMGLPRGIIHADFFPNNVFFDEESQLCGVIDFYFACDDLLAYDLAIVANAWCFDAAARFDAAAYDALLAGYASVRPLNAEEREAMPILLRVAALRFLLTRLHDMLYHDPNALVTPHDPMHYARILQWHQAAFR